MKEFCNFQNCGLSFTLFNKLVWALIMENGCREQERGSEGAGERGLWQPLHSLPISQNMLLQFSLWGLFELSFLGYLDNNFKTAEGKVRKTDIRGHVNPSVQLSPLHPS